MRGAVTAGTRHVRLRDESQGGSPWRSGHRRSTTTPTRTTTSAVLTHEYKRLMHDGLGFGLALESLAALDAWPEEGLMKQDR